jgi:hypothetical protein
MKSPEMEAALSSLSEALFGRKRVEGLCVICGKPATEFRNEISRREHEISRMCQACQDSVFGGD